MKKENSICPLLHTATKTSSRVRLPSSGGMLWVMGRIGDPASSGRPDSCGAYDLLGSGEGERCTPRPGLGRNSMLSSFRGVGDLLERARARFSSGSPIEPWLVVRLRSFDCFTEEMLARPKSEASSKDGASRESPRFCDA